MTVCLAEDRVSCEPAVQVLVASLAERCSGLQIRLFAPHATPALRAWLKDYADCTLDTRPVPGAHGWNVKAQALLSMLDEGLAEVVWLDSDIVVCRDFRPLISDLGPETLVIAEEGPGPFRGDGEAERCKLWGFEVGRTFPHVLNSCVLRVTASHRELLQTWRVLLESPEYRAQQQASWQTRSLHMLGDQDVLTALLASVRFASIPLMMLGRGEHVIQYFGRTGYPVSQRLRHLFRGMPPFIHSQVTKPWLDEVWIRSRNGEMALLDSLHTDLSPYTMVARRYRLRMVGRQGWMEPHGALSRVLRILGGYHPPLVGLPLEAALYARRLLK